MPVDILYSNNLLKIIKDTKVAEEEYVVVAEKGVKIKYYKMENKKMEKIVITGKNGKYEYKSTVDKDVETLSFDSLKKAIAKDSRLKFALEYVKDIIKSDTTGGSVSDKSKSKGKDKSKSKSKSKSKDNIKRSAKRSAK